MSIIEKLDTKRARNRASFRALAQMCGATVSSMDEDMGQPDPRAEEDPGEEVR